MRVAILDHTAELGGAELALLRLLEVVDRERVEPVVVLFSSGPLEERIRLSFDYAFDPRAFNWDCFSCSDDDGTALMGYQFLDRTGQPLPESYETEDTNTRRWQIAVADTD